MDYKRMKGFTLIELLAVIIILAIIAVIATSIILGVIDDSKLKVKENSVNGIMDAVRMTYSTSQLDDNSLLLPLTATIASDGVITVRDRNNTTKTVSYSGSRPILGTIKMDDFGNLSAHNIKYSDGYTCTMAKGEHGCTSSILTLPGMVEDIPIVNGTSINTGRYIFKGENPNNYIELKEIDNLVTYRIVSIELDGTLKVVRNDILKNGDETVNMQYDLRSGDGTIEDPYIGPRKNSNNSYCNYAKLYNDYYGCNAWNKVGNLYINGNLSGTVTRDASINIYLNQTFYNLLDDDVKKMIVTNTFNTTGDIWGKTADNLYETMNGNNKTEWDGKIGLLTVRDWFVATANEDCNPSITGSGYYKSGISSYECSKQNYLFNGQNWWTISPYTKEYQTIWFVYGSGFVSNGSTHNNLGIRPVFYLSPNTKLSGSGTLSDPYKIKN